MAPLLLLLVTLQGPSATSVGTLLQDQDAAVQRAVDEWVAMWNSYDLDEVERLFVADETVTYFSSETAGLIQGIVSLVEHHRGFGFAPGGAATASRLWLEEVEIRKDGSTAVVLADWLFQRAGADGPPQKGPVTFVFVARGGTYRILHAHFANAPAVG
ncbi:MAG: YybH family protein [Planctomycetota bacterium]|jgi:ketosteroid isomerase-like protein